jgi:hypothetical protein
MSGFWERLHERLDDPEFRREFERESEWIAETDRLVNEIPDRREKDDPDG